MRPAEAQWIGQRLSSELLVQSAPVIELGANTADYHIEQAHIHTYIHAPLTKRGVRIVTTDLKSGDGVDIAGDIFDPAIQRQIRALQPQALLCCNIFEHVADRKAFAAACDSLLPPGALIIVTVPRSYPYHLDPIDTGFRPTPSEICALFPSYERVETVELADGNYASDLIKSSGAIGIFPMLAKNIIKSLLLRGGLEESKSRLHRLLWLVREYRTSGAALRKSSEPV